MASAAARDPAPSARLRGRRLARPAARGAATRLGTAALLAAAALAWPIGAGAQQVVRTGRGEPDLDRRLDRLLAADPLVIARDTLLPQGAVLPGPVLVADARLILEGTVAGDLVGVGAELFLRPGARVAGSLVNVAGGLYRSDLATVEGEVLDRPLAPYRVVRAGDTVRIEGVAREPAVSLDGLAGFEPPTYDRVNGLTIRWGASVRLPPVAGADARLLGAVAYRTELGDPAGSAVLRLRRGATVLSAGAEVASVTNEEWIRGDLMNSLSYLVRAKDYRDYHEVRRAWVEATRELARGAWRLEAAVRGQLEGARSLPADDPWALLPDDDIRPNLAVDEGAIASAVASLEGTWAGRSSALEAGALAEVAPLGPGAEAGFARWLVDGEWAMRAFADHELEVEWRLQGPFPGTARLPRRRWTFVGGSGTLRTLDMAAFRGGRLVYVETEYVIPLPRFELPYLGVPELSLLHAAGMAWTEGTARDLEQNVGLRLEAFAFYARLVVNPADPTPPDFDLGLTWPFDSPRPWEGTRSPP